MKPADGYSSTTSLADLCRWLRDKHDVVALTHEKPDGDALGSTLALTRALLGAGLPGERRAEAWFWAPWPHWARTLVAHTPARFFDRETPPENRDPDAILLVDTGSWSQVEHAAAWLRARRHAVAIIDHHRQGDPDITDRRAIDVRWAATAQPAAELCRLLLGLDSPARLPRDVSEPLYLGLASDTGWFRHSNLTPSALRLAADLLDAGTDHAALYQATEQQDRPERLALIARALNSLTLHYNNRVAVMTLTRDDFTSVGAFANDAGGIVDLPATIASVRVCVLLTEPEHGPGQSTFTKVSLRSKGGADAIDVNAIAGALGGGGHTGAAGARVPLPIDQARARVLELLGDVISKARPSP
jgi:phosphoesterase RecJ-like protein